MKLGGHQTFPPRPGWLTKGLMHLSGGEAGSFSDRATADGMGVGINMSKSIGWWMGATGLATRGKEKSSLELTEFGRAIADGDPFMTYLETLWLVHACAVTCGDETSLQWFMSPERPDRFGRSEIADDFSRAIEAFKGTAPSDKGVHGEVSTIMRTYAAPVVLSSSRDPEDNLVSPFHRLGLFSHVNATDRFERTGNPTPAPPEALGLLLSALCMESSPHEVEGGKLLTVSVTDKAVLKAGAYLGCTREQILELAGRGGALRGNSKMSVETRAGERIVRLKSAPASVWAGSLYRRLRVTDRKAA